MAVWAEWSDWHLGVIFKVTQTGILTTYQHKKLITSLSHHTSHGTIAKRSDQKILWLTTCLLACDTKTRRGGSEADDIATASCLGTGWLLRCCASLTHSAYLAGFQLLVTQCRSHDGSKKSSAEVRGIARHTLLTQSSYSNISESIFITCSCYLLLQLYVILS